MSVNLAQKHATGHITTDTTVPRGRTRTPDIGFQQIPTKNPKAKRIFLGVINFLLAFGTTSA